MIYIRKINRERIRTTFTQSHHQHHHHLIIIIITVLCVISSVCSTILFLYACVCVFLVYRFAHRIVVISTLFHKLHTTRSTHTAAAHTLTSILDCCTLDHTKHAKYGLTTQEITTCRRRRLRSDYNSVTYFNYFNDYWVNLAVLSSIERRVMALVPTSYLWFKQESLFLKYFS